MSKRDRPEGEAEIVVTEAMIEAGVECLDFWAGTAPPDDLVERVYRAMVAATRASEAQRRDT